MNEKTVQEASSRYEDCEKEVTQVKDGDPGTLFCQIQYADEGLKELKNALAALENSLAGLSECMPEPINDLEESVVPSYPEYVAQVYFLNQAISSLIKRVIRMNNKLRVEP